MLVAHPCIMYTTHIADASASCARRAEHLGPVDLTHPAAAVIPADAGFPGCLLNTWCDSDTGHNIRPGPLYRAVFSSLHGNAWVMAAYGMPADADGVSVYKSQLPKEACSAIISLFENSWEEHFR